MKSGKQDVGDLGMVLQVDMVIERGEADGCFGSETCNGVAYVAASSRRMTSVVGKCMAMGRLGQSKQGERGQGAVKINDLLQV